jgi:two-component system OmpR family response regulator
MGKAKILVIDDSEVILDATRITLEDAGYEVVTSDNPLTVAADIRRTAPDLVLLDINMPAVKGDLVAQVLGSHSLNRSARLVLHSDIPAEELAARTQKAGAFGYIAKTQDEDQFVHEVEKLLARPKS